MTGIDSNIFDVHSLDLQVWNLSFLPFDCMITIWLRLVEINLIWSYLFFYQSWFPSLDLILHYITCSSVAIDAQKFSATHFVIEYSHLYHLLPLICHFCTQVSSDQILVTLALVGSEKSRSGVRTLRFAGFRKGLTKDSAKAKLSKKKKTLTIDVQCS